jgi:hypothetical protein
MGNHHLAMAVAARLQTPRGDRVPDPVIDSRWRHRQDPDGAIWRIMLSPLRADGTWDFTQDICLKRVDRRSLGSSAALWRMPLAGPESWISLHAAGDVEPAS